MAQLRLQVLLLLLIWLLPKADGQILTPPAAAPCSPGAPHFAQITTFVVSQIASWSPFFTEPCRLAAFTSASFSSLYPNPCFYFSSESLVKGDPCPWGSRRGPIGAPLRTISPLPAVEPTQLRPLCLLSPARGLSAGREPPAAQGPVSNVTLPRP